MRSISHAQRWIYQPAPRLQPQLRLYCFPYAGADATLFHSWPAAFPPNIELCAIALPSRGSRFTDAPVSDWTVLIEQIATALQPYLDFPYAFFGHSMGALICFELTRYLRVHLQSSPIHLFVSGAQAPQRLKRKRIVHDVPDDEFLQEIRTLNGTPSEVLQHPELMQLVLPALRADFKLVETYRYVENIPFACPITAFGGLADTEVSLEDLEGWQQQTKGVFRLSEFPGDHFFLHNHQREILRLIVQGLGF